MQKSLNPDYPTSPCLQHAVVSVDGKLIPFAYPSALKSPKLCWPPGVPGNSADTEPGTMRLNTNPMHHLDQESLLEKQENFYHTLTPFTCTSHYEECQSRLIHPRPIMNYPSDTLRSKQSAYGHSRTNRFDPLSSSQTATPCHHVYHHHHAPTIIESECVNNIIELFLKSDHFQMLRNTQHLPVLVHPVVSALVLNHRIAIGGI